MPGVEIEELGMERDHIHMVVIIPPQMSVSQAVGFMKQQTSKGLRKKFSWLHEVYKGKEVIWSAGYFVSTVGVDEEQIKRYVEFQGKKDSGQIQLSFTQMNLKYL